MIKIIVHIFLLALPLWAVAESLESLSRKEVAGTEYYLYEAKKGESAYGIAKKFGWDITTLLKSNPSIGNSLKKGTKLYYPVNGNNSTPEKSNKENLSLQEKSTQHVVKKGETIYSIANLYQIPLETLYNFNPSAKKGIKTGEIIIIPDTNINYQTYQGENWHDLNTNETREVAQEKTLTDNSPSGFISTDNNLIEQDSISLSEPFSKFEEVRIALILDEPTSKKDIDFTRGFLTSLPKFKDNPYKVDLKVLDGGNSSFLITEELDDYGANLIISTADKTFPLFLVDYGNSNNIPIVNVFDIRSDFFTENPSIIQILPPSKLYYEKLTSQIYRDNNHRKLIVIGEKDENDGMAKELINQFGNDTEILSLEEFGAMEPDIMQPVLLYSYASKKEDVNDFLNNVEHLSEVNPGFDFLIIGRSNWIALTDDIGDKFNTFSVIIPSRVWIDEESKEWKSFISNYEDLFDSTPIRSIPNFAASGYDIGNYFINLIGENEGLLKSDKYSIIEGLQNDIQLNKNQGIGSYTNDVCYLIKFTPEGNKEKIIVK